MGGLDLQSAVDVADTGKRLHIGRLRSDRLDHVQGNHAEESDHRGEPCGETRPAG
jgi:hypothetical protein